MNKKEPNICLPPLGEESARFLKKILGDIPAFDGTANYRTIVKNSINREIARKPRRERPVKATVRRFVEWLLNHGEPVTRNTVLEAMQNDEALDRICYARSNPAPLAVVDVDFDTQIVKMLPAGTSDDDSKKKGKVKFTTINSYIRRILKQY